MREILFRGKRTDCEAWVEGDLIQAFRGKQLSSCSIMSNTPTAYCWKVIPETVGQFTGLTDKNGVKIFEGDICRFKRFNDVHVGKVIFNVTTASFIMWYQPIAGAYGEKATQKMLLSVCDDIEVIGNIHDNSEILKNSIS